MKHYEPKLVNLVLVLFVALMFDLQPVHMRLVIVEKHDLDDAFNTAKNEATFKSSQPEIDQASIRHQISTAEAGDSIEMAKLSRIFESVAKFLIKKFNLTKKEVEEDLASVDLTHVSAATSTIAKCRALSDVRCPEESKKYRTADGSCNNLENPNWGRTSQCFRRLVNSDFGDGLSNPRKNKNGDELPNPRFLSQTIHVDLNRVTRVFTLMLPQFGQLISHDMSFTTLPADLIKCCNVTGPLNPSCLQLEIFKNDTFFEKFHMTCMEFLRSTPCSSNCGLGPRNQINQATSFLDLSVVYGNTADELKSLRSFKNGKLLTQESNHEELLPKSFSPKTDQCSFAKENKYCFQAGDGRVNENPLLASFHTIFLRQHNRIAGKLQDILAWKHAKEEEIFQETRRIVIAQYQAIIYKEFLPMILGSAVMKKANLEIEKKGEYSKYDKLTDPSLVTEFATAAQRFGHSLIENIYKLDSPGYQGSLELKDNFFVPFSLYNGSVNQLMCGLSNKNAQTFDRHVVSAVTNFLYKPHEDHLGLDLVAFNILRGRDHGIPGYTTFLNKCLNMTIKHYYELKVVMSYENIVKLSKEFPNVDDIDLFTGGLAETPRGYSIVGPTFSCILSEQFHKLKFGDRFYFEHDEKPTLFAEDQLNEIRKTSLSEIICHNSKIPYLKDNVFIPSSRKIECSKSHDIDLKYWESK